MHSAVLRCMEPKLTMVVGARCPRGMVNFLNDPIKGRRSFRGQSALEMPYDHQIWSEDPLTRV